MTQSANRSSILGWVKTLKRNTLLNDSINEIDNSEDISTLALRSPPPNPSFMATILPQPIAFPSLLPKDNAGWGAASGTPDLLRPLLSHKSRSTQNVGRERSSSNTATSPLPESSFHEIRQHRDSFLQNNLLIDKNSQYFGVPLSQAVEQAAAKISILGSANEDESVLHYGRIPIVVAKCGVYLKTSGLNVEGIFRVAGSSKRIKELQFIFNTPPSFGKKLSWDGFTVHDAASVLRRYLNALPEPLIVLDLYEDFRDILRSKPRIIKYLKYRAENPKEARTDTSKGVQHTEQQTEQQFENKQPNEGHLPQGPTHALPEPDLHSPGSISPAKPQDSTNKSQQSQLEGDKLKSYKKLTRDMYAAISEYKELLDQLPCLSKQLLFYILDLLAMVQNYSLENLMSSRNLAAIFQPSILLHPNHDMDPEEYALSQSVVEFLIQYAYKILPSSEGAPAKAKATKLKKTNLDSPPHLVGPDESSNVANRQYSKSFSTNAQDFEMIGYKTANQQLDIPGSTFQDPTSDEDALDERTKPIQATITKTKV